MALTQAVAEIPPAELNPGRRVAVIGGGMLGMTMSHRLAREGTPVCLFESAPSLGGLAGAWSLNDVVWDRYYHVTLLSDLRLRGLLSEIGLKDALQWVETRTGFFTDGEMYSMSNSLEFLRFPPLGLIDKFRLAATIVYASRIKDWKKLERVGVADWLRRYSGERTFQKIWLPLLKAKLGDNYKKTSAAFIWSTIARMYAARRSGLKKEMFGYVPGGYARITEKLEESLRSDGVGIRLGNPVVRVERSGELVVVTLRNGETHRFGQVVMTLPGPIVSKICPDLSENEKGRLEGVCYQGIVCASVLLDRPLGGYYVTNITDSGIPFTAVIEMSALVDRAQFGGQTLVYLPKYVDSNDAAFDRTDKEIQTEFMAGLTKIYPDLRESDVNCFRVSRARYVHALSTLGYSESLPPVVTSVPGVRVVNSSHIVNGTLNVNETVKLAELHSQEILADGLRAWK